MMFAMPVQTYPFVLVEMSPTLTLGQAQGALEAVGPGRVFAVGEGRYVVSGIHVVRKHGGSYTVEVKIVPLPRRLSGQ